MHRSLHRFDALATRSDGLIEHRLESLIGFDQLVMLSFSGTSTSRPGSRNVVMRSRRLKIGKTQSCTQHPATMAKGSTGDPRIECGTHESRDLAWSL
jgi:hypothetical protein